MSPTKLFVALIKGLEEPDRIVIKWQSHPSTDTFLFNQMHPLKPKFLEAFLDYSHIANTRQILIVRRILTDILQTSLIEVDILLLETERVIAVVDETCACTFQIRIHFPLCLLKLKIFNVKTLLKLV